jgi:PAS domain S-box-containing protein
MSGPETADSARRAEVIFRAITDAADQVGVGVAISYADTPNPELIYVNEGISRILGWSLDEIRSRPVWTFLAPEELPRLLEMHERRLSQGTQTPMAETLAVHRDGRLVPVEFSTSAITLDGRAANVTFLFDITERKRIADGLRESEARFRSFVENAPDGVLILRWPKILFANRKAAFLLGTRDPADLVGRSLTDLMPALEFPVAERRVGDLLRERRPLAAREYTGRDPEGRPLTVEFSSIVVEHDGAPAVLAFARDVTERRSFLAKLTEADKFAAVGTLAAGVAHEINNPLAYLLLNLEFVLRELRISAAPPRIDVLRQHLEDAKQGAERVRTIVRDLQALTRRDDDIRGPVDLAPVINAALHMARHAIRPHARIERKIESVPPVHGNATRFEQLFLNLLLNAAHALGSGDPEWDLIEVTVRRGPDGTVAAEVRDTGEGMAAEVLERAFEPFFTTKPMGVGTGLGLPICRGIVQAVGGEITLESVPGRGTTARVLFREHPADAPAAQVSLREVGSEPPPRTRGRVLIVDDEPAVALSLSHELGRRHEVQLARSAAEADTLLTSGLHFDAVLCDLVMPDETGMALYDRIRGARPDVADRFVFMTGGAFLPDAASFLARAGRPYVEKPFDLVVLRRIVDDVAGIA